MLHPVFKEQIAQNIGISIRTFQRKLSELNIEVPRGYIRPDLQKEIYEKLGYSHIWEEIVKKHSKNNV